MGRGISVFAAERPMVVDALSLMDRGRNDLEQVLLGVVG